jgi:hypothetical protein
MENILKDTQELLIKALAGTGSKDVEMKYKNKDESDFEGGDSLEVGRGWFLVYDVESNNHSISIFKERVIRGCHTMSNGDPGYPDETDYDCIVTFYHLDQKSKYRIVRRLLEAMFKEELDNTMEDLAEAEFTEEEEHHVPLENAIKIAQNH